MCLTGCGGIGNIVPFSIYEGTWVGTWDGNVAEGPASLSIDADGNVTGTMHSNASNEDGPVVGRIQNNGFVTMTVDFPSEDAVAGSGTLLLTDAASGLDGVVTFAGDPVTFDLAIQ